MPLTIGPRTTRVISALARVVRYTASTRNPFSSAALVVGEEVGVVPFPTQHDRLSISWQSLLLLRLEIFDKRGE